MLLYFVFLLCNPLSQSTVYFQTAAAGPVSAFQYACPKPCVSCSDSVTSLTCPEGVTIAKDGCGCCNMCTRQEGEMCSQWMICDSRKDLVCRVDNKGIGFCRKRTGGHPCILNTKTYRDGELFNSTCRYLCLCQNGRLTCSDNCPHHDKTPNSQICPQANLVSIPGRCCKEWICETSESHDKLQSAVSSRISRHEDSWDHTVEVARCPMQHRRSTDWSPCSVTCGIGISQRQTNDNSECRVTQQTRLCQIRPDCSESSLLRSPTSDRCRATIRQQEPVKFHYEHKDKYGLVSCESVRLWKPKYCANCKKPKCCKPSKVKTKLIEFKCSDSLSRVKKWAWIKRCQCTTGSC